MQHDELKALISEVIKEELAARAALTEAVEGPRYVIKAWSDSEQKATSNPTFDSDKQGVKYEEFDDVIKALQSSELSELGAYEITWIKP